MELRILISGTGGQGVVAAGEFLSEALFRADYVVVNTRSYGAEARGGSSRSEVLVSDGEIYDLELGDVDILIAMSMQAYKNFIGRTKKNSLVLLEDELLKKLDKDDIRDDVEIASVPASETATMLGNPVVANMVILGALSKKTGLLTLERLEEAVKALMRPSLQGINIEAIKAGYSFV
jgi:2-oxoglutarate ferredoxin oxidoreductase subunit gamma